MILTAAAIISALCISYAQTPVTIPTARSFDGERLLFDAKLNKNILRGIGLAELTFESRISPDNGDLIIRSSAVSKGTLTRLFRYSFTQNYVSTIDTEKFRILATEKHDVQKERVRDSVATFNYRTKMVTFTETDPKEPNRPPRTVASSIEDGMQDIISAIFYVRTQPMEVGKRFILTVSDSGLNYDLPVKITGRDRIKSSIGKKWCFRLEPEVFGSRRLIEQKGRMQIWMTDDDRRIPVRTRIDSQYGRIEIRIKQYQSIQPVKN